MHFTTDAYDIFKYKASVTATTESFDKRKDKYRFEKIIKELKSQEIIELFVANFISNPGYGGLTDDQSEKRYMQWKRYNQSLTYNFASEVRALLNYAKELDLCYNDVFFSTDSQHPLVIVEYLAKTISIETFIILNRLNSFTQKLNRDIVTGDILKLAKKYSPFIKIDTEIYGNIAERIRRDIYE